MIEISRSYRESYPEKSIQYAQIAVAESRKTGDRYNEGMALGALAMAEKANGKPVKEVIKILEQAKEIFHSIPDPEKEARVINTIGIQYDLSGNYQAALRHYLEALKIYEEIKFEDGISDAANNVGIIYEILDDYDLSMKYYKRSMEIAKNSGDTLDVSKCLANMASVRMKEKKMKEAEKLFNESLRLKLLIGDSAGIALAYNNVATIQYKLGNTKEALGLFEKSAEMNFRLGYLSEYADNCYNLAYIYDDLKQTEKALHKAKEAYKIVKNSEDKMFILKVAALLSDLYKLKKEYEKSLEFATLFIGLNDDLNSMEKIRQTKELKEQFETEKKEQQLELEKEKSARLEEERLRTEAESNRKNIVIGAVIFITLLFIVLAVQLYRNNKQKQQANILLADQNAQIREQKELIEEKHREITDSINYAKRIQTALLASDSYWNEISNEHFILFKPRDVVSGDFFRAFSLKNERGDDIAIWCVADCTGHGVPGAFMSMLGISFLNEIIMENRVLQANRILDRLREKITRSLEQKASNIQQKDGLDIALCVYNKKTMELEYAGANNSLWIARNHEITELKPDKMPVGLYAGPMSPFTVKKIMLQKNDWVYAFTDGYADQFGGPKGKKFKYSALQKLVLAHSHENAKTQHLILESTFFKWKGELEQIDDICITGLKI